MFGFFCTPFGRCLSAVSLSARIILEFVSIDRALPMIVREVIGIIAASVRCLDFLSPPTRCIFFFSILSLYCELIGEGTDRVTILGFSLRPLQISVDHSRGNGMAAPSFAHRANVFLSHDSYNNEYMFAVRTISKL